MNDKFRILMQSVDDDLLDNLMVAEDDEAVCAKVIIETTADAEQFALDAAQVHLPICIVSENKQALECALYLYTGRVLVQTDTDFDCARYGAVRL